ncbi:MAG: helix-hairpin-helix domain-containing protein [Acidobacteriota bacterium]|nr:MAG: helix-hairpin-helix domain-containing protein [Acidobacteriota bacterium]
MNSWVKTLIVSMLILTGLSAALATGEPAAGASSPATAVAEIDAKIDTKTDAKIDVNTAGVDELTSLPGIGPALARRIVDFRKQHGPFRKVEELLAVKGIGPRLLAKIRDRLTVGSSTGR